MYIITIYENQNVYLFRGFSDIIHILIEKILLFIISPHYFNFNYIFTVK